jgi:hypothetical protein
MKMTAFVSEVRTASMMKMKDPDDTGSAHLWNVGLHLRDCAALYPRMLSPYSPHKNLKSHRIHYLFASTTTMHVGTTQFTGDKAAGSWSLLSFTYAEVTEFYIHVPCYGAVLR